MKQYIVDAFTNKPFSGNPAAVCVMDKWPSEEFMKNLATVIYWRLRIWNGRMPLRVI